MSGFIVFELESRKVGLQNKGFVVCSLLSAILTTTSNVVYMAEVCYALLIYAGYIFLCP